MAFEIPTDLMVSVSGVRGRVGEALTPDVAEVRVAYGVVREARGRWPRVIVGRNSRTPGRCSSVPSPLRSASLRRHRRRPVPTPTAPSRSATTARTEGYRDREPQPDRVNAPARVRDGMFLDAEEGPRMRAYVTDRPIPYAGWDGLGEVSTDDGAAERHVARILGLPYLDVDGLRRRRFKVALDCIRGAGAKVFLPLLEALGCEVVGLNLETDGRFPREPEPVAENLGELGRLVVESGADLGLATDPDADRLSRRWYGRASAGTTLALAALLVPAPEGPIVTNLSSRILDDVATQTGSRSTGRRSGDQRGSADGGRGRGDPAGRNGVILPEST